MDRIQFYEVIYSIVKEIPVGYVTTYGQIAYLAGQPQYARMVGRALFHAPKERHLPCHRVVNHAGRLAPNFPDQRALLTEEGVAFRDNGCVDMKKHQWNE